MQRRVLDLDWASTPLGSEAAWSTTLRTVLSTCLNSRFGMLLMWGPELVMLYNDGYAPMLGSRHRTALGERVPVVWPEIWSDIEPMIGKVFAGGVVFSEDLPLVMTRHGFDEETYFTFCYSPVMEPGGRVAGLLNTVVETTSRVLAARRLRVLQQLGSLPGVVHGSAAEACAAALRVLADARADCPLGLAYLTDDNGIDVEIVARHGIGDIAGLAASAVPEQVRQVVRTGLPTTITGLATALPGLSRQGASPAAEADVHTAVVLPLLVAGRAAAVGAVLLGASPHLRLDDAYRAFLGSVAGQVAAAVTDARVVERERRRAAERAEADGARARFYGEVAVTLQRSILGPTTLPAGFAVHYAPATGALEVGGDWYDVIDLPGGLYGVVVGDVVGRGLPAAAVMGQLRSAARALLLESRSPRQVLAALDRFAALVPGAACSTVFCAVVDPALRSVRYSSAGHLPAILTAADGCSHVLLADAQGLPLAVADDPPRPEAEVSLPPTSSLLLYTDGLVERRGEELDDGIARAAALLVEGHGTSAPELAALLTDQLLGDSREDDVAFLVYRVGDSRAGDGGASA